jgi:peptidyl-prolyl cis-trans isomerase D
MLQDIRDNSQSTIAKIIVFAVIISLSIFGIEAIVGGFGGEPSVATVNGNDITEREFQRAVQIRRQQILREMERPDPTLLDEGAINSRVLDNLIDQALVYQDAKDRGLDMTDAEIDRLITSMPAFQVDGQFNQQRFMSLVRNQGMGIQEFRQALRRDYITRQIQLAIATGAFVNPETARELLALQRQSRSIATLSLDESLVADQVTVTDDEIESFYAENDERFMRPESVDVAWIELDRNAMKNEVEVAEEDLRALYQQRVETMEAREERRAAHILLIPESGGEVAAERIAEVEAALEEGQEFAEVAQRLSDDPGSANSGGDLGFATRDSFEEAFSEALFSVKSEGEVVGPVKTSYGVHFIKLLDVRTQEKPKFEELRDNLRDELATEKANGLYIERSDRLADIAFSAFDLEEPAAELGLEIQRTEDVTRGDNPTPFDHNGLVRQLFAKDVLEDGNNTELVEVADGRAVVARVTEHHPEQKLSLAEVEGEIRQTLRDRAIGKALDERAAEWIAALEQGEEPSAIATKAGAEWTESRTVQRDSDEVPPQVLDTVFRLPHPEGGAVYSSADVPSGVTVIQLNSVEAPTIEEGDQAIAAVRRFVEQQQGGQAAQLYLQALRQNAEIERQ